MIEKKDEFSELIEEIIEEKKPEEAVTTQAEKEPVQVTVEPNTACGAVVIPEKVRKTHRERYQERMAKQTQEYKARHAQKMLERQKMQMKKAADRFHKKRVKLRTSDTPMTNLKNYDSELEVKKAMQDEDAMVPRKITPDIERILFPYYISGASIRSIHQQFGHRHNFSLQSIYTARDFYKWEQRKEQIHKIVRNDGDLAIAERFKDYYSFMDDLISEAMIRFKNNSETGANTNPFNTLKISNMKDMKDIVELMMNILHGGVKKMSIEHNGKVKLGDKKRSKLLEVLAEEDDGE